MTITVKLFASLAKNRFDLEKKEYAEGTVIRQILEDLLIPPGEAAIIFVNNRHAPLEQELYDGDVLAFFPPIGGG